MLPSCSGGAGGGFYVGGGFYHQHAKHLATIRIRLNDFVFSNILLHLLSRQLAQRMGLVAERIRKPFWLRNVCM